MTRLTRAVQLRDAALDLIRHCRLGNNIEIEGNKVRATTKASQMRISDQERLEIKYLRPGHARSYGLNIWVRSGRNVRKVLNIEWDESGAVDVVSFRQPSMRRRLGSDVGRREADFLPMLAALAEGAKLASRQLRR
jgi:hypothetical protein